MICLLQSCTKVALDFVSPENVGECLRFTEEIRKLPVNHCSTEDKLEVCLTTFSGFDSDIYSYQLILDIASFILLSASLYNLIIAS